MTSQMKCYAAPGEATSPMFAQAFAAGSFGQVISGGPLRGGPLAMFGSPKIWDVLQAAIADGRDWYYGDHAYFGRHEFYRVTKNRYQHAGVGESDGRRFELTGRNILPWKKGGRHILLCPPGDIYAGLFGFTQLQFIENTVRQIALVSDRRVIVRQKPAGGDGSTLPAALKDAHCLVTFMSNAAMQAVLMGCPVFVTGECSALTMGSCNLEDIETPEYPDGRREWSSVLADNQWTFDEISRGDCWRAIGDG